MSAIDNVLKKFRDIATYADIEIPRDYYTFSAPSLTHVASGGQGLRGIQSGSIIEIAGAKSAGKSTISLDLIRNAQQQDKVCAILDYERSYSKQYAEQLGVDTSKLIWVRPDYAEQGLDITEEMIKAGVNLIVIDSVAMMLPKEDLEKTYDDSERMAAQAKLITRFINRVTMLADNNNALIVLLNQLRANISPMSRKESKHFGGYALAHGVRLSIELVRIQNKDTFTTVQAFVEKNKLGGAERLKTEFQIEYGKGIRADLDIIDCAIAAEIIQQRGAWLEYAGKKVAGKENATREFDLNAISKELETYYAKAR